MDQITYDLGGSVAYLPSDAQVSISYMAPNTKIREMLEKARMLGVVTHTPEPVEAWLQENVGEPGRIRGVAQEIVRADQATGGFLTAAWQSTSKESFDIERILSDAEETCEILESVVLVQDEHEALLAQHQRFRAYMKLQLECKEYRSRSKRFDHDMREITKKHDREDMCQHRESQLRFQQFVQQEKLLQQRLDMEKFERRKEELQQLRRAKHDNDSKGNEVYRHGMVTQLEILQFLEPVEGDGAAENKENTRFQGRHQSKAFLQAFVRGIRERVRRVQVILSELSRAPRFDLTQFEFECFIFFNKGTKKQNK